MSAYDALQTRIAESNDLLNTINILNWDARTQMPAGGAETRGCIESEFAVKLPAVVALRVFGGVRLFIGKLFEVFNHGIVRSFAKAPVAEHGFGRTLQQPCIAHPAG